MEITVTHISNTKPLSHSLLVRRQQIRIKVTTHFTVVIAGAKRQYCKRVKGDASEVRLAATTVVSTTAVYGVRDFS
jgi:hypothetical protein